MAHLNPLAMPTLTHPNFPWWCWTMRTVEQSEKCFRSRKNTMIFVECIYDTFSRHSNKYRRCHCLVLKSSKKCHRLNQLKLFPEFGFCVRFVRTKKFETFSTGLESYTQIQRAKIYEDVVWTWLESKWFCKSRQIPWSMIRCNSRCNALIRFIWSPMQMNIPTHWTPPNATEHGFKISSISGQYP